MKENEKTPLSKDPKGIGLRMIQARLDKNISVERILALSGVTPRALVAIEAGNFKDFSLHDLNRVRKALGLSLSYVMDGEEKGE